MQYKTRQDNIMQGQVSQCKTTHVSTIQHRTTKYNIRQYKTIQDNTM